MGRRGFAKKAPFADLDQDFKDTVANMSEEEISKRISEVALNEHENRENKKKDMDLKEKQSAAKFAGAQYVEATVDLVGGGSRGDTASGKNLKDASLTNGKTIKVPLFVESGEKILVNPRTLEFVRRA